jgi:hypothetical protein
MADVWDGNDTCVLCNTKENAASNLSSEVFLVNKLASCGHKFCASCVDRQFSRKRVFSCPKCGGEVKKGSLSEKSLDELECEKDVSTRRRIKGIYNLSESDFDTLLKFQDYEEEVECIIFNLVHGVDEEETKKKVAVYKEQNARRITEKSAEQEARMQEEQTVIAEKRAMVQAQSLAARYEQLTQKKEQLRARRDKNAAMLGDVTSGPSAGVSAMGFSRFMDAAAGTAGTAKDVQGDEGPAVLVQNVPNLLAAFLYQREAPKWTFSTDKARTSTVEETRSARRAGGYDGMAASRRDMFVLQRQFANLASSCA